MKNIRVEKNKVLVIGAKGMLGQELVSVFKKDGDYEVIGWDREDIDITKSADTARKINKIKPGIIINATGYNAVDKAEEPKEFKLAKKLNGTAPGNLAEIAKKLKAVFVNYSTSYVFDGHPEITEPKGCKHMCSACTLHESWQPVFGFDENAKPNPINKYGESKLLGEKEIKKNGRKYYIIRLSYLFGKPGKSKNAKRSFFDLMLELSKKSKEVKAVDEEAGCFTYAPDLAKKTREILEAKKPYGIYHIVNSEPCTWYEAVVELYNQAKIKTKIIPVGAKEFPRPAKRPYYSVLLNTKLNPLRSWKEALKEYLKIHPVK